MRDADSPSKYHSSSNQTSPFPDVDRETDVVQNINKRMMEARDDWEPPETPTYNDDDATSPYATGIVRAIDETNRDGTRIKLGLDTGTTDDLHWVTIEDTGDRATSNPWIRLCHMYDVNPEFTEEFYNTTIAYNPDSNTPFVRPHFPVFRVLWYLLWYPHYRFHLWEIKKKPDSVGTTTGRVPTRRFFPAYVLSGGAILGGQRLTDWLLFGTLLGAVITCVWLFLGVLWACSFGWGLFCKLRADTLPYIAEWTDHLITCYQHRNG